MNVLGFSGLHHSVPFKKRELPYLSARDYRIAQGFDSAAALVTSSGICAAAAEERFTRDKATGAFPYHAIRYCLGATSLAPKELDYVAHGFHYEPYKSLFEHSEFTRKQFAEVYSREAQLRCLEQCFPVCAWQAKLVRVPHHLAHAASTFYPSGFTEALILVADGMGEIGSTTIAVGCGNDIEKIAEVQGLHSLGILYGVFTLYLGFCMGLDEYKVMGLAPYGNPRRYFTKLMDLIHLKPGGGYAIPILYENKTLEETETYGGTLRLLAERFGAVREPETAITQDHMDVAAALQAALEESLLHVLRHFKAKTAQTNLCMAGGVALNCTANGLVQRSRMFKSIFIQPAAGDDGTALGAALYTQHQHQPQLRFPKMTLPLWGPDYGDEEIENAFRQQRDCAGTLYPSLDDVIAATAQRLAQGQILGWFQGRMEFGPRALGGRSILADPRDPKMRSRVNRLVKKREDFRPFAPAVTCEAATRYFDIVQGDESLYAHMLFVTQVKPAYRDQLPAITHVDGSARVQTVSRDDHPRFWTLLNEFGNLTGMPVLLNTSFNVRGQPIVCTPTEAIDTFLAAGLDALVIGNYVIAPAKAGAMNKAQEQIVDDPGDTQANAVPPVEWNNTKTEYPNDKCVQDLFEAQVDKTPDAVAVAFGTTELTYAGLNKKANRLAHHLIALGVGPEVLVGVCVERSIEMVAALLAIWKAGGAYLPLDPNYPEERLAFMLEDGAVPVLLTQKGVPLPRQRATLVYIDSFDGDFDGYPDTGPESNAEANNLAYVIYTSGSTGRPKGVAIEHRSAVALLCWAADTLAPEQWAGTLASTSICFDLSVFELFVPLSVGGAVILVKHALELPNLASAYQVTLINTVPSAAVELLRIDGIPASVRSVNLAGEPLSTELARQLYDRGIDRVYDLYGPTETTTYSTFALRSRHGPATIGHPIANTQVYILDPHLNPVPIGVPGELHIGGAGLARGYLNRPELTAEKFIANPFRDEPGSRLYKTGDLARYLADGNIEFLGRMDDQVKIRGFRIELGEIETVLNQYPDVKACAVLAREDTPGDRRLIAYVVGHYDLASSKLRAFLNDKLPEYMLPATFVVLDKFPLTANGKLDRNALPAPECRFEESFVVPRTPTEEKLAAIFVEVLKLEKIGIHDNFFELGGHSLLGMQVISRIRKTFNIQLPLRSLFEAPTVAVLAEVVERTLMLTISDKEMARMLADLEGLSPDALAVTSAEGERAEED